MRRAIILALAAAAIGGAADAASAAAPSATAPSARAAAGFQGGLAIRSVGAQDDPSHPIAVVADATIAQQCDPGGPCAFLPFVTTAAAGQPCRPQPTDAAWVGEPFDEAAAQAPQAFAASWREWPSRAPGPKRACLYVRGAAGDTLLATADYTVPPPIVLPPGAGVPRTPIPRTVGTRRSFRYRLSLAAIPRGVDRARFSLLVRAAARRWGLRLAGTTGRAARSGDGVDSVGFAAGVPSFALGVTTLRSIRYYRQAGGRRRLVRERVVERDTRFALGVPWHAGPGDPPPDRVDLQTVVIHELGHFAGNGHVRNCSDSPMWVALRAGEWWHGRGDWFQHGCGRPDPFALPARAASAGTRPAARTAAFRAAARPLLVERVRRDVVLR